MLSKKNNESQCINFFKKCIKHKHHPISKLLAGQTLWNSFGLCSSFLINPVSPPFQAWICCSRRSGIQQMTVWKHQWSLLSYPSLPSPSRQRATSQNMNFLVTAVMTSWSTPLLWPAVITSVVTVSLCGGSPRRRTSAQSVGRNGQAFQRSTYCWGKLLTEVAYQCFNVCYSGCFIHFSHGCSWKQT